MREGARAGTNTGRGTDKRRTLFRFEGGPEKSRYRRRGVAGNLLALLGLLGQKHGLDVGQHSSLRDIEVYISRKVHFHI